MRNEGYHVLATAHHAEDQLETVLMQVAKGRCPIRYSGETENGRRYSYPSIPSGYER